MSRYLQAFAFAACGVALVNAAPPSGYSVTFADEFNGDALDTDVWAIAPSRPNAHVEDGALHLVTEALPAGMWREGFISTKAWSQRFGYYEARFRIGAESGLNNAFWLNTFAPFANQPNNVDRFEIDIMEAHYPGKLNMGIHDWSPTHWGNGHNTQSGLNLSSGYHTYAMEWTHDQRLKFYFDGQLKHTINSSVLTSAETFVPLAMLFSTKVIPFAGAPGPGLEGTRMIVDYVRAYDTPGFIGPGNNWGAEANWASGAYARAADAAIFNRPSVPATLTIAGESKAAREVYLDHPELPAMNFVPRSDFPAAALRIGSSGRGAITVNSRVTQPQTFSVPVIAETPLLLINFSSAPNAALRFTKPIKATTADEDLNFLNTGRIDLEAPIEATFGNVEMFSPGVVSFSTANAHTGETRVARGTLLVSANGALGTTAQPTHVASGSTLALAEGVQETTGEALFINGAGANGRSGALEVADATGASMISPITLGGTTTFAAQQAGGALNLSGTVHGNATGDLLTKGAGDLKLSGAIKGLRNLIHTGPGTLRLDNAESTFGSEGTTVIGTLYIAGGTGIVAGDAPNYAPGVLGSSTYRVRVGSNAHSNAGDDATLLIGGAFNVARPLQIDAKNHPGTTRIGNTGPQTSRFSGGIFLQRELTVTAAPGGTVRLEGAIVDDGTPGSLMFDGPGTVDLTAINTFTGGINVTGGTVNALGRVSSPVSVHGGALGGTGRITAAVTVGASGGLRFALNQNPVQQLPLRVESALAFQAGAKMSLSYSGSAVPGSKWTVVRANSISGPVPALELPPGWTGSLAQVGGELQFTVENPGWSAAGYWRWQHFGTSAVNATTAANSDPDSDGLCNLLEFALQSSPMFADPSSPLQSAFESGKLELAFNRRAEPSLYYEVQAANSLVPESWSTIWSSTGADNVAGPVKVTDPLGTEDSPRRFLRLRVTSTEW